jgi:hypothetical protein
MIQIILGSGVELLKDEVCIYCERVDYVFFYIMSDHFNHMVGYVTRLCLVGFKCSLLTGFIQQPDFEAG